MSHFFDEPDWLVDGVDAEDEVEAGEGDDDEPTEIDEEVEVTQAEDPYMERRAGGRRVKEIPDVAKFLDPDGDAGYYPAPRDVSETIELAQTQQLSDTEDADVAQTMVDYSTQSAVYQAALKAGSQLIQPTLLDFLR